jgi:D-arabinose 1-dehydrogenase-like Zn-dependent alcohol dehydrogenase
MFSIAVLKENEIDIVELPKPEVGPYDVLVKTKISGICNATDRKPIHGQFPGIGSDWYPILIV